MAEKIEAKKEPKEEFKEYTIPLRKSVCKVPKYKRANKAIKTIKKFLAKHMKVKDRDLKKIKLDIYLNEFVWRRGIKKPPAKIKVKAREEAGIVRVELAELPRDLSFKKQRLEKRLAAGAGGAKRKEEVKGEIKEEQIKKEETKEPEKEEAKEKKEAEEEKKVSVIESTKKLEKEIAKKTKHQTIISKQPKRQRRMALEK